MGGKFFRIKNGISNICLNFFKEYKFRIIFISLISLIFIITGILTCAQYSDIVTYENLIDKYLFSFLKRDTDFLGYFLTVFVFYLLINFLIIVCSSSKFFVIVCHIILCLACYVFGFDLCIIMLTLGLSGIIYCILFRVIWIFVIFNIIILLSVVSFHVFAKSNCIPKKYLLKLFLILAIVSAIILFLSIFLFSSIHIFIIID